MTVVQAKVVLMDIEGTTTSISFVKDVLFPYAKTHSSTYLQSSWDELATQALVKDLCNLAEYEEFAATLKSNANVGKPTVEQIANFVNYLIDKDLKLGPLKTLQGYVWAKGYTDGTIKGHVYDDVPDALRNWQQIGLQLAIYSSGSVKAQKLLFGQTEYGNLLAYIAVHFDTEVGHKQEKTSYVNISRKLGVECGDIVFLTDIVKEAEAARDAGLQTVVLNRPGNAPLSQKEQKEFLVIDNFNDLCLQKKNKIVSNNDSLQ